MSELLSEILHKTTINHKPNRQDILAIMNCNNLGITGYHLCLRQIISGNINNVLLGSFKTEKQALTALNRMAKQLERLPQKEKRLI